ncbi:MAG: DedA family protein [Planctomycetes bacterium]|nr:DedA family protein [Planctomycetota bacterium]MCC7170644.1 DedA family protein [Planctomycetota bacterium]
MDSLKDIVDFVLHLNDHLRELVDQHGTTTYWILFAIVFAETGLVVTPFLPGDSLLFAAGSIAALGSENFQVWPVCILLTIAAIVGDTVNYWIGKKIGAKVFATESRWIKREHLEKTHAFYEKYGAKTIVLARFVPIVRTLAPFVAGVGTMNYRTFITYNVVGGVVWVFSLTWAGYFFGNMEIVKKNFSTVILAIIVISILPLVIEWWKAKRNAKASTPGSV